MKKPPCRLDMTDKEKIRKVELISSAIDQGQRSCYAAEQFGITHTTYLRWKKIYCSPKPLDEQGKS